MAVKDAEYGKVSIFAKGDDASREIESGFRTKLANAGFTVVSDFDETVEFIVCIGGDGSLLSTLAALRFPATPLIGVNTGHVGFFQELQPGELDEFIFRYREKQCVLQELRTLRARIVGADDEAFDALLGLNEIAIHGAHSHVANLHIFIGDSFIETFRGDGILVSTPAGSTAYNYALGGSIVDPRLDLLQITPIAPINNSAYRSFTSSVLLPPHLSVNVFPEFVRAPDILIAADGAERTYTGVKQIHIAFSGETVRLLRFPHYDFWNKVKQKLL
ncbi:MAG: NAD(+)/NADH kinase [Clostridiales Family XIII bacterium]|jgi:NAD+ kinase|nr:NAD(+)/NADH kinase [Clostridiales Family XIII bacterium]